MPDLSGYPFSKPTEKKKENESTRNESGQAQSSGQVQSSDQVQSSGQNGQAKRQASKPTELVLSWSTRQRLIDLLDQCSSVLFRAALSKDAKNEMLQNIIYDLISRLICLPSSDILSGQSESDGQSGGRRNGQRDDNERPKKKQRIGENGESKPATAQRPFFEIPLSLRTDVVNQLFCNLKAWHDSDGSDESKKRIADQNARLNIQLLNLPIKFTTSHALDESDPLEDEPPTDREITSNSEITIDYELENVSAFFRSKGKRSSKVYMCAGMPWSLNMIVNDLQDLAGRIVPYLGFYLHCYHGWGDYTATLWPIFDLIILDPVSGAVVKQCQRSAVVKQPSAVTEQNQPSDVVEQNQPSDPVFTSYKNIGLKKFIKYEDLKKYVHNDRLKVQIRLWCDHPVNESKNIDHSNQAK